MKKFKFIFCSFFFLNSITRIDAQSTIQIGTTTVGIDTVYIGLDVPWEIIYGPDNYLWVTERKGIVSRIDPVNKTKQVILDLTASIYAQSEGGLLGMKLHPNFAGTKEVYLVYTYGPASNVKERLVKYTYNNNALVNPQVLIDSINAGVNHNGSRLLFLPDNTLLMTTGDALNSGDAQNLNSKNGKVLRLNTNGTIPSNNPFAGSYVYTLGHRNPQGLLLSANGTIYESEHGPANDDEFQILEAGRNYGWPNVEGFCNLPSEQTFCTANNVKEPLLNWTPTIAPSDFIYYNNPGFPEFHDRYIMTVLKDKELVAIKLNSAGTASVAQAYWLTNMFGRMRDICVGPNNEIYIATDGADPNGVDPNTETILRLSPPNTLTVKESTLNAVDILVYPTVTSDNLTIELLTPQEEQVTLKILDGTGDIRKKGFISTDKYYASLTGLSPGFYFLILESGSQQFYAKKIIKN